MKFRRYLGHDCDSVNGFNNGQYIDERPITAESYDDAMKLCQAALSEYLGYVVNDDNSEDIGHGDGPCVEVITGHFNSVTGAELSEAQIEALDGEEYDKGLVHYRYVYVSAESEG